MTKSTIDLFSFLKQRKADASPVSLYGDHLAILAEYLYGTWQFSAKFHDYFKKEIEEDI